MQVTAWRLILRRGYLTVLHQQSLPFCKDQFPAMGLQSIFAPITYFYVLLFFLRMS